MDLSLALREVLDYLETGANPAFLNYDIVSEWDAGVLAALLNAGLIAVAPKVASLECRGCEERCFMDVTFAEGKSRAYVVCDVPHKQAEMGRIAVPLERLQQWQCSPQLLANAIVSLLG